MKVGIMQPYFLPYIGYFQLINAVDKFVIYDDANYIKQGWINRNRILLDDKPFVFHIQLSGASSFKKINEISIGKNRLKVFKTIQQAYSKAAYYQQSIELLAAIFHYKTDNLAEFTSYSINRICSYLKINSNLILSSQIEKDNFPKGESKIINICNSIGAETYINAIGGKSLYSSLNFLKNGIQLYFLNTGDVRYKQYNTNFIKDLSIVDVLMFNDIKEISGMLNNFALV